MQFDFKTEATITLHADEIDHFFNIVSKITPDKEVVGFRTNKFTKKEMVIIENLNKVKEQIYVKK
jgi:hypothetical protein